MSTLERATEIAVDAHRDQSDKSGNPYILHPLKVLQRMETEAEKKVAVLHDAVEDSENTLADLRDEGFSEEIVEAIKHLTKAKHLEDRELEVDSESYEEFIERVNENELARKVKIADLEHNMDVTRLQNLTEDDTKRLGKYHSSWKKLQDEA